QPPVTLAIGQIHIEGSRRRADGHTEAITQGRIHVTERGGGIAHVNKIIHPDHLGEIVRVLDAGNRQRRRPDHRIAAIQAYALIAIAAYGSRPARTVPEVLGQAVGVRPDFADLAAYGQDVAPPYRPPLLYTQAAAVKRLAFV